MFVGNRRGSSFGYFEELVGGGRILYYTSSPPTSTPNVSSSMVRIIFGTFFFLGIQYFHTLTLALLFHIWSSSNRYLCSISLLFYSSFTPVVDFCKKFALFLLLYNSGEIKISNDPEMVGLSTKCICYKY